MIEAFGHFLVGGNYAVGLVVFVILVVINFIVITKGAGRIAEVGARFTLDAMPGKQMAIDADLNAGLIGEEEARKRRAEIAQEADFYGSMDGASKFVRGDAIAGILILFINIVGGLVIGVLQHDMDIARRRARTTRCSTIGDGLVAQIPALIISTAAGLVVSARRHRRGHRPAARSASCSRQAAGAGRSPPAISACMGLDARACRTSRSCCSPAALGCGARAAMRKRRARSSGSRRRRRRAAAPRAETPDVSWDDVAPVDALGLEVGYRLIPLVDQAQDGELLRAHQGDPQQVRAGDRLPAAADAHPRQPRARARTRTASR